MRREDLRGMPLFEGLRDDQLDALLEVGDEVAVEPGREYFREGEPSDFWWVLVSGAVDLVRHVGREDVVVGRMTVPGRWAGGLRAWDPHGAYLATGRGVEAGTFLRVPADQLRARMQEWLPLSVHLIGGLYGTARSIESTARQRDALVTLGTLAAGLAHELNNPAAAATRAVDGLAEVWHGLLGSLTGLAEGEIGFDQFLALDDLRAAIADRPTVTDALALADREDELERWLTARGVPDAWRLAASLAAADVDLAWCERAAALLPARALAAGLGWVAGTAAAYALIDEVREATGRVSELVSSVRSYTQMDRGSRQRVDVTEGLENTLIMLGHKVRRGNVEVLRDYDPARPEIEAHPGELNQVWTNLLDNALDAMQDGGTLTLTTVAEPDALLVVVRDTGRGMTPEVAARAFDPFFTTKEVGHGTGLGLDIARRIVVERHGGTIEIDPGGTDPGSHGTAMRVRLPR